MNLYYLLLFDGPTRSLYVSKDIANLCPFPFFTFLTSP